MLRASSARSKSATTSSCRSRSWQKSLKEDFETKAQQEQTEYRRQVFAALYGPDHPYTLAALETPEAAAKVHRDALDGFRKDHYTAGNATLVVVGDFDPAVATKLVTDTFGSWDRGTPPARRQDAGEAYRARVYVGVIGKEAAAAHDRDRVSVERPASMVEEGARQVLAQMLNQRTEDMRFKLGSTYGLYMIAAAAHRADRVSALGHGAQSAARSTPNEQVSRSRRSARLRRASQRRRLRRGLRARAPQADLRAARPVDGHVRARGSARVIASSGWRRTTLTSCSPRSARCRLRWSRSLMKTELDPKQRDHRDARRPSAPRESIRGRRDHRREVRRARIPEVIRAGRRRPRRRRA